jgi:hypothetical protein
MRAVYSHITGSMREESRTGLERLWEASLAERVRLTERSAISVLDNLLAAR